jgi:hypothetical protein
MEVAMLPNVNSTEDIYLLLTQIQDDFIDLSYSVEQAIDASENRLDKYDVLTLKLIVQHLQGFEHQINNVIYS